MPHVMTRPGRLAGAGISILLAVVHAANDLLMATVGVLLPTIQARFDASTTDLAALVAVMTVSSSAPQPLIGAVAERLGLRRVIASGVAVAAVSMSLVAVAPSMEALALFLVVGGLGSAALHPIATSIVGSPVARNAGVAVGLFTAGGMMGFALGPAAILWFVRGFGVEATIWLMIPGLVGAAVLWRWLPDWAPHSASTRTGWHALHHALPRLVRLVVVSVLVGLVFLTVTSTVPLWLVAVHGLRADDSLLGWVLGALALAAGAGAVAGGAVGGKVGYRAATTGSLLLAAPAMLALVWLPVGAASVGAAAMTGALLYVSQPLLVVRAQELVPEAPAAAAGLVVGLGTGLSGALYVLMGTAQATVGLGGSLMLAVVLLPLAVVASRPALPGRPMR